MEDKINLFDYSINRMGRQMEISARRTQSITVESLPVKPGFKRMVVVSYDLPQPATTTLIVTDETAEIVTTWWAGHGERVCAPSTEKARTNPTYSLFADIASSFMSGEKVNTMHREFGIWSDNLDAIIDARIQALLPAVAHIDGAKLEGLADLLERKHTFTQAGSKLTIVNDGQVRNPEVQCLMSESIRRAHSRYHTGGLVSADAGLPPVFNKGHEPNKPDIAPNTMREFLVDFIAHSDATREALQERRHKAEESDKLLQMNSEPRWSKEIYDHSEMVIAAHRLLKVIP